MSDIENVKKLREATGAGFKDCNLAIKESGGDIDKAIEILRVKGISKASKKMSREAKEGVVAISGDEKKTSASNVSISRYTISPSSLWAKSVIPIVATLPSNLTHSCSSVYLSSSGIFIL